MPVYGQSDKKIGNGYIHDPIYEYAKQYSEIVESIGNECNIDVFTEASKALRNTNSYNTLFNFFVEQSCDQEGMSPSEYNDHMAMMEQQFVNNVKGINEFAHIGGFNPIIGLTFPIHKNILMNCVYDKGAIQKAVAASPKFTLTLEERIMVGPDGIEEIDIFKEQDKITELMNKTAPFKEIELNLPYLGDQEIVQDGSGLNGSSKDNLSIDTHISAIKVKFITAKGEDSAPDTVEEKWVDFNGQFTPTYGQNDRTMFARVSADHEAHVGDDPVVDNITGIFDCRKNNFVINCTHGKVTAVKLKTKLDASRATLQAPTVRWRETTDIVEIGDANPIATAISPDEIKDVQALYQADQLAKIMSLTKDILLNYKDDTIKSHLDRSFLTMDEGSKFTGDFDFAPRTQYALDHVEWRKKTFMDALDTHVTSMIEVLNDPNMVVTVIGRSDLIRKIKPTEYSYLSPAEIGPMILNYERTVVTSDNRTYNFISAQKLKGDDKLYILLKPVNTERITYRIYDYQMVISNEIRAVSNLALPAVYAYERWKFVEYQPIQARITILNPTGLKDIDDDD